MTTMNGNPQRIMARVTVAGECWEWDSISHVDGYGRFRMGGRQWLAHRASYTVLVGPIPEGLNIDHLCRNRRCVNPEHLEPVTQSENLKRSPLMDRHSHKTHCPRGHAYEGDNVRLSGVHRHCRTCDSMRRYDTDKYNLAANCPDCEKPMRRNNIKRHQREACESRLGLNGDQS
jgi:hypothetical protein